MPYDHQESYATRAERFPAHWKKSVYNGVCIQLNENLISRRHDFVLWEVRAEAKSSDLIIAGQLRVASSAFSSISHREFWRMGPVRRPKAEELLDIRRKMYSRRIKTREGGVYIWYMRIRAAMYNIKRSPPSYVLSRLVLLYVCMTEGNYTPRAHKETPNITHSSSSLIMRPRHCVWRHQLLLTDREQQLHLTWLDGDAWLLKTKASDD